MTTTQKHLLDLASNYTSPNCPIKYDTLKALCSQFKTFDQSFNSLLRAGYFERHRTADNSNQFKRTSKN